MRKNLMIAAVVAGVALATSAQALQRANLGVICGSVEELMGIVQGKYEEQQITRSLTKDGVMYQTWLNPETGSWTVTRTMAQGIMCAISTGEGGVEFFKPSVGQEG